MKSKNKPKLNVWLLALAACLLAGGLAVFAIFGHKNTKTSNTTSTKQAYVALGDSVAAGTGLNTSSDSSACNRTEESFPHIVAIAKSAQLINIACSGATLPQGILGSQTVNGLALKPQLDQLFAQTQKPELVSVTIGANDVGWSAFIAKCYTGICGTADDTAKVDLELQKLSTNLNTMLSSISSHYGQSAPVVVLTGYHQVFPQVKLSCLELSGIDQGELNWTRARLDKLNATIKDSASKYPFAKFGEVNFTDHELCTAAPWVQGISSKAPFHPNEDGQSAFSQAMTQY